MLEKQNDNFQFIFPMAQCYKNPKQGSFGNHFIHRFNSVFLNRRDGV